MITSNTIKFLRESHHQFIKYPSLFQRTFSTTMVDSAKVLTLNSINPNVKTMEYAVRGPIVIRAVEIEEQLAEVIFYSYDYRMLHISSISWV